MPAISKANLPLGMSAMFSSRSSKPHPRGAVNPLQEFRLRSDLLSIHTRRRGMNVERSSFSKSCFFSGRWFAIVFHCGVSCKLSFSSVTWLVHWCSVFYLISKWCSIARQVNETLDLKVRSATHHGNFFHCHHHCWFHVCISTSSKLRLWNQLCILRPWSLLACLCNTWCSSNGLRHRYVFEHDRDWESSLLLGAEIG